MRNEQFGFDERGFEVTVPLILDNRESVVDFFGDNRKTWYHLLLKGGSLFGKTSLDSHESFDTDLPEDRVEDLPPLSLSQITEGRAKNIVAFFKEYPEAARAFQEYFERDKEREVELVS